MTTTKAITEIRQKLEIQSERLARMEERQRLLDSDGSECVRICEGAEDCEV